MVEGWQSEPPRMAGAVCEKAVWPLESPHHFPGHQHAPSAAFKERGMQWADRVVLGFAFSRRCGAICSPLVGEGTGLSPASSLGGMSPSQLTQEKGTSS